METILKNTSLSVLLKQPVLFDANIFMVGIEYRGSDKNCSFENMKELYIRPLLESFTTVLIHEEVYRELDDDSRELIDEYIDKNIQIVGENGLYDQDAKYVDIFNKISKHELVQYNRKESKNRGEVYSMAYAAYYGINYFSSKDIMVDLVAQDIDCLRDVNIITFDIIVLVAYIYFAYQNNNSKSKALKSIYKRFGEDVIKRHRLPITLGEYIKKCSDYL